MISNDDRFLIKIAAELRVSLAAEVAHHAIADGDMRTLDGFGTYKEILKPRQTDGALMGAWYQIVGADPPTKPTLIANQTLVRLDGATWIFYEHRGRWELTTCDREVHVQTRAPLLESLRSGGMASSTPLTKEQRGALKTIDPPRVVTIRIIEQVPGETIILFLDELLGMPILAIGNIRASKTSSEPWSTSVIGLVTEWRPDGYMPPWLEQMNPIAKSLP
jgi:hypothetical protein